MNFNGGGHDRVSSAWSTPAVFETPAVLPSLVSVPGGAEVDRNSMRSAHPRVGGMVVAAERLVNRSQERL
jgi:hypothetical protein